MSRTRVIGMVVVVVALSLLASDVPRPSVLYAPLRQPLRDAQLYVDRDTSAAHWQAANSAVWLDGITSHPQARWINRPKDIDDLPAAARDARRQQAMLLLVIYYIPNRDCLGAEAGAASGGEYDRFIDGLIDALGRQEAVVIVEPDAVAADCFDDARADVLKRSVRRLAEAGHHVYLDAGHPRWRSTAKMAGRLRDAGIRFAEGFSVNVSNRQTTEESYTWALELSSRIGKREFVIDTSRNGIGPPPDNEWCNPAHEALGEAPTTDVRLPRLAALLWIKPPGESDGPCGGVNHFDFSPQLARNLLRNAQR